MQQTAIKFDIKQFVLANAVHQTGNLNSCAGRSHTTGTYERIMFWLLITLCNHFHRLICSFLPTNISVLSTDIDSCFISENLNFIEIMQLWTTPVVFSCFIHSQYFQHWHRLLYQHLFLVKMFAWCACVSIYERSAAMF